MKKVFGLAVLVFLLATGVAFGQAANFYGSSYSGAWISGERVGGAQTDWGVLQPTGDGVYGAIFQSTPTQGSWSNSFTTTQGTASYGGSISVQSTPGMTGTIVRSSSFSRVTTFSPQPD